MEKEIVNDYVNGYMGTMELSQKYGVNRTTIQRILIKNDIVLRKKTPKLKVNHFYFSKYNEENCYWAGFILADGYIRTNGRFTLEIKLQKQDVNHLYKFKKAVGYEGRVIEREKYYSITISSPQIIYDLENNFEIRNKKSLNCTISDKIPQTFLKEYIRGYFDGDGSITFTTIDTISFLGTEQTVDFIRNYFYNMADVILRSKKMPEITHNNNIYAIYYSGKSAYKCLNYIYSDSKTHLDRKYKKYNSLIQKYV